MENKIQPCEYDSERMGAPRNSSSRYASASWITWFVDGSLLCAAMVGACYAWPIQSEAGRLHVKRLDLQRRVGEMPISDPAKYHVLLLKSENPLEFRWRFYVPPKTDATLSTESGSSTGSSSGTSSFSSSADPAFEGLITATKLPAEGNSNMEIRVRTRSLHSRGSIGMNLHDETIQQMVDTKDTSSWRIAGKGGVEAITVDELVWLLKIESPIQEIPPKQSGMIRIGLGTQAVIAKERAP